MIVDFHTHLGKGDPFYHSDENWLYLTPKDLVGEMNRNSIDKAVVIPNYRLPSKLRDANLELSLSLKPYEERFFKFAWLDPRIEGSAKLLEDLVSKSGFRGLKLHPVLWGYYLTNKSTYPLIEKSIELSIPILIHTGWGALGKVSYLEELAQLYRRQSL
jgi:hypothetical protein